MNIEPIDSYDGAQYAAVPSVVNSTIANLYSTLSVSYSTDDITRILTDRIPGFVERTLRELETRRLNRYQIDATIETIVRDHCTRFVYNPDICTFYEVGKQRMQLRIRTIDSILLELLTVIPISMRSHRRHILRAVRTRLTQQHVFEWTPSKRCVERMTQEVQRNFGSYEEAVYFMSVVGAIVLRKENELFGIPEGCHAADDDDGHLSDEDVHTIAKVSKDGGGPPTTLAGINTSITTHSSTLGVSSKTLQPHRNVIHLWHGPRVEEVVECVQRILHLSTCTFSAFWNRIKRRMHRSYPLSDLWCLNFPPVTSHSNPLLGLKQSPVLWLTACCQHYRNTPPLQAWEKHPTIRYTRSLSTSDALFSEYIRECVHMNKTSNGNGNECSVASPALGPTPTPTPTPTSTSTSIPITTTDTPLSYPPPFELSPQSSVNLDSCTDDVGVSVSFVSDRTHADETPTAFLLFREIAADFSDFLVSHSLPPDILTKQELLRLVNERFEHVLYGTRLSKRLYCGTLTVSVQDCVYDLFLRFTQDTLLPGFIVSGHDMVADVNKPSTPVTIRQLHNNYKMWCRQYAQTLSDANMTQEDVSISDETTELTVVEPDHHTKHWYCSYTLFEKFMNSRYGSDTFETTTTPSAVSMGTTATSQSTEMVSTTTTTTTPTTAATATETATETATPTSIPTSHPISKHTQDITTNITKLGRTTWNCRVVPHKETWRYYLQHYKREQPTASLSKWILNEFGIQLADVTYILTDHSSQTNSLLLDAQDIGTILDELQKHDTTYSTLQYNL